MKRFPKGQFQPIPEIYSKELSYIINQCLQLNPILRPNCKQILSDPKLKLKFKDFLDNLDNETTIIKKNEKLLNTIKLPEDFRSLQWKFPKSNYNDIEFQGEKKCNINL